MSRVGLGDRRELAVRELETPSGVADMSSGKLCDVEVPVGESPDEVKFISAYEAHVRSVLGYALRRTDTPADAADVVAETMLTAWRRLDVMPDEPETVLWLYGVARNVIANSDRSRRRQGRLAEKLRAQLDDVLDDPPVADPALAACVTAAMKSLTAVEREVLTLTATEQLAPAEISVVLDMKQNTVRTHLHRARKKMRAAMAPNATERPPGTLKRTDGAGHDRPERPPLRFHRTQGAQG